MTTEDFLNGGWLFVTDPKEILRHAQVMRREGFVEVAEQLDSRAEHYRTNKARTVAILT